jgi:hypothetical protein
MKWVIFVLMIRVVCSRLRKLAALSNQKLSSHCILTFTGDSTHFFGSPFCVTDVVVVTLQMPTGLYCCEKL